MGPALSVLTLTALACSGGNDGARGSLVKGGRLLAAGGGLPHLAAIRAIATMGIDARLDSCVERRCAHASASCDDHDTCTIDSCDAVGGLRSCGGCPSMTATPATLDACDPASGVGSRPRELR